MNLVLMGPPGAGKGTQAKVISKKFNIPHISTGDMLREAVAAGTDLGKRVAHILEEGLLVPDELMFAIVKERLQREDTSNGFILDGYPRTVAQAQKLKEILQELGKNLDAVILITSTEEEVVKRISSRRVCPSCGRVYNLLTLKPRQDNLCDDCGTELIQRKDDLPHTVRERYRIYVEKTAPVLEFYRKSGVLKTVDGSRPLEEVSKDLFESLENM
ncbi:MAG: adenylate kinase [Thermotogae bacterium]|uniref:Adenylate kinase n=1 Tax=Kosmotoga arenicorallina TaxID=688066 RepID=A0A7C5E1Q7_9BACT|nr:adenylate kinase [Kosmotoga sp.]MBO8166487.1 adenylate kinase [Kosmotoga sp.]MCD6160240.1 adenylate kinase [Kosmotoga sp.]RKX51088.1 MAG: adenylate kinase [Thermotogota bacterium]HHF08162.1 adenylate kinase [Kosmotoga arenicorallina]